MRAPSRAVLAGVLLVSLVLAGIVSFYAASTPDGLSKVAQDEGFAATETEHETGEGPFADYSTRGIDSERLSGGLAGVAGVLVTLVIAGGIAYAVRRRGPVSEDGPLSEGGPGSDDGPGSEDGILREGADESAPSAGPAR